MNVRFIITLTLLTLQLCNAYIVLFLAPFNGKSHSMFMQTVVRALLDRGHEVTYLTGNSLKHLKLANYTEYLIEPSFDFESIFPIDTLFNTDGSPFATLRSTVDFVKVWNLHNLESENTGKLINSTGLHFDVIINEELFGDSFLMFAHKFKAPVITVTTFGYPDSIDRQMGLLTPFSVVPHWTLPSTDQMSFYQRWYNTIVCAYDWYLRNYVYLPTEREYAQRFFGHHGPLPSIDDLMRNISMALVNTNRAIFPPRPSMPSVIGIGGAHIKPTKPLPNDLKTFLDESKHGVIYFCLGSVIESSKLPKEKIKAFLDAFNALKQRVLWKFEDESRIDIPSNVMVRKWLPQNDILAHPNVILFIGHGGLFGTTESVYHGVPLLLIPFFSDEHRNAHKMQMKGLGKILPYEEISKESLLEKINDIISNESFMAKAKQTSAVFRDNLLPPIDEAMFWIEHVAKFKGARHLKSHAVHVSWFTYLLLDVIIVNMVGVLVVSLTLYYLVKKLFFKKKIVQGKEKKQQ